MNHIAGKTNNSTSEHGQHNKYFGIEGKIAHIVTPAYKSDHVHFILCNADTETEKDIISNGEINIELTCASHGEA